MRCRYCNVKLDQDSWDPLLYICPKCGLSNPLSKVENFKLSIMAIVFLSAILFIAIPLAFIFDKLMVIKELVTTQI